MKTLQIIKYTGLIPVVLLVLFSLTLSSCGEDDSAPSAQDEIKSRLIAGEWTLDRVTVDGVDETDIYEGLAITFSETGFTTTNGGEVWPANGGWSFVDEEGKIILRSDGVNVLADVQDSALTLSLTWDTTVFEPGRTYALKGEHVFFFTR